MDENTDLFSGLQDAFSALADPSILHWQAVFFGEWVYGVFDSPYPINYPVSAVMVSLASLNIVALAGLLLVLFFTGAKSLLSGLVTADIASGTSKFTPVRLLLAFGMLMPTHAGIEALDDYNISISNVQVNTMRLVLLGGAIADWVWLVSGKALFDFNIGGAPTLRNTVARSNDYALGFVCNQLYHETIGKKYGEPLFSYLSGDTSLATKRADIQSADSFSDIQLPAPSDSKQWLSIMLGGANSRCGVLNFIVLPDPSLAAQDPEKTGVQFKPLLDEVPVIEFMMRQSANAIMLQAIAPYAEFAKRYHSAFGQYSVETIFETRGEQDFTLSEVNLGTLQTTSGDLKQRLNGAADALIYLSQNLAYSQQSITNDALSKYGEHLTSGANESIGNATTSISERVFERYLYGYVSAGMFWSLYQDFAALTYDAERYADKMSMDLSDVSDSTKLCENTIFGWFGGSEIAGIKYHCETVGHLSIAFDTIASVAAEKASIRQMPTKIDTAQRSYEVDVRIWTGFYSTRTPTSEPELGFFGDLFVNLFEGLWKGMSIFDFGNDGNLIGSGAASRGSLLSGSDALLLNLSGQNSPYIMLTQLGEGMRDIAFVVEFTRASLKALKVTAKGTMDKVNQSLINKLPQIAALTFIQEYFVNLATIGMEWGLSLLMALTKALTATSLILIYALPSIPTFGWTMIIVALIFTAFAAMAAVPFSAILLGLPKGDGVFAPDTERIVSLLYGVFLRQPMTVVGFVGSIAIGYIGMSILNLVWFSTFFTKLAGVSTLDSIFFLVFIFVGYGVCLFFICLYSFRVTSMTNDAVGVWVSSTFFGGAFGSHDSDMQSATQGIKNLSSQLDDLSGSFSELRDSLDPDNKDKGKDPNKKGDNFNA